MNNIVHNAHVNERSTLSHSIAHKFGEISMLNICVNVCDIIGFISGCTLSLTKLCRFSGAPNSNLSFGMVGDKGRVGLK